MVVGGIGWVEGCGGWRRISMGGEELRWRGVKMGGGGFGWE